MIWTPAFQTRHAIGVSTCRRKRLLHLPFTHSTASSFPQLLLYPPNHRVSILALPVLECSGISHVTVSGNLCTHLVEKITVLFHQSMCMPIFCLIAIILVPIVVTITTKPLLLLIAVLIATIVVLLHVNINSTRILPLVLPSRIITFISTVRILLLHFRAIAQPCCCCGSLDGNVLRQFGRRTVRDFSCHNVIGRADASTHVVP
mmetsp:Transcript_24266/g.47718  ORF Transcript_24266/g.47718 Transcript_24266/m.47718 type:complete len:204 (-) Transcript_24266:6686-7297(-)